MMELFYSPSFWVAASFVVFMWGFIKYAMPFIVRALDNRTARIRDELDEAIRLREEAQAILTDYQKRYEKMQSEAEAIRSHAEQEAEAMLADAERELKASIDRRARLAHEKIARAESEAIQQIQANMVDVAVSAARVGLSEQMEQGDGDALIESTLKGLDRVVH